MRRLGNSLLGLSAFVAAHASPASAGYLLPIVPVAGSVAGGTGVFGINDDGTIVGAWFDANNVEHGYFGSLAGSYTKFDAGPGGTEPRGIANDGAIVGYYNTSAVVDGGQEFERDRRGAVSNITKGGVQLIGIVQGINNSYHDTFAGDYYQIDSSGNFTGVRFAYLGNRGRWLADIAFPKSAPRPAARGVNGLGVVVGYFVKDSVQHGFILQDRFETQVDYPDPNAQGTILEAVNDAGQTVGQWTDSAGNSHSFTYDIRSSRFTPINVPGASNVQAFGLNNSNMIAVNTDTSAFIYCSYAYQCRGGGSDKPIITTEESIFVPPEQMRTYVCAPSCTLIGGTPGSQTRSQGAGVLPNTHWRLYARP